MYLYLYLYILYLKRANINTEDVDENVGLGDIASSVNNNGLPEALGLGVASGSGSTVDEEGIVKFCIVYFKFKGLVWGGLFSSGY